MAGVSPEWGVLSSYAGLLSLATFSIYAGSYNSLPSSKSRGEDQDEEDGLEDSEERLSMEEAYLFPLVGSVVLLGLYLVVKYLGTAWINWLLGWYFSIAGVGSVWQSCRSLLRYIYGSAWKKFDKVTLIANKGPRALVNVSFRTPSLFLFPIAVVPSAAYHLWAAGRRSIIITDILGLSFTHNALSFFKLDSFKTGSILLSGLFLYDVFWVFKTDVMVKVATTLDVPIKLLWPKSLSFANERGFTLLGLGDIVIPGTFVALALRYDYFRHSETASPAPKGKKSKKVHSRTARDSFNQAQKPYFTSALIAYILGLTTTMTVMHIFHKAQPALLYLSPACIFSFVITAVVRGEFAEAWSWTDMPLEKGAEKKGGFQGEVGSPQDGSKSQRTEAEANGKGHDGAAPLTNGTAARRSNRQQSGRR